MVGERNDARLWKQGWFTEELERAHRDTVSWPQAYRDAIRQLAEEARREVEEERAAFGASSRNHANPPKTTPRH